MVRRWQRWLAGLVMLGVALAQLVTVAHACALAVAPFPMAAFDQAAVAAMPSDCAEMAKRAAANAKLCESHCAYGQQIAVQPDSPVAAIAPQPALSVSAVASIAPSALDTIYLHARSTAPPVSILFSRFLI